MPPARWALLSDHHALGAALAARLPARLPGAWTMASGAPRTALAEAAAPPAVRGSERYDGAVLCPGVPFAPAHPPRPDRAAQELARLGVAMASLGAATGAEAKDAAPIARLVLLSSAAIYSPRTDHPGLVRETPAVALRPANSESRRWRDLELRVTAIAAAASVPLTVLRPAPVVVEGGDDAWSRNLRRRTVPVLAGHDPTIQLLALEDLVEAIAAALERGRNGVYHVAPAGVVPLRAGLRLAGSRPVPGARLLRAAPLGGSLVPLDYLRNSFTVSGEKALRELALPPARTSAAVARGSARAAEAGDSPSWDAFGYDPDYCRRFGRTLWRFAHDVWWRVEVAGLEHVPREGAAVLAGIHRGYMPMDAIMLLHLFLRDLERAPRFLVHPALFKLPFIASFIAKIGGVFACQENADLLLARGDIVGVLPEGVRGAFSEYRDAYRIKKFGRDDFARIALRNRAPILPFVTIGPAESMPILRLWQWGWWKRTLGWPGFPITPTFPFLPPLPTKWHTLFLPPLHVASEYPPEAAGDRDVVREISARYRRQLEAGLGAMLGRRTSIWRGSIFDGWEGAPAGAVRADAGAGHASRGRRRREDDPRE